MSTKRTPVRMSERVKYDYATSKWFKSHPFNETTVMRCDECGLYYKPSLGHKCKKSKEAN